jgi:hypothetical protein
MAENNQCLPFASGAVMVDRPIICRGGDRLVVGFTTTCAISAYHHFEFWSWRDVLHTTLCDKVCQLLSAGLRLSLFPPSIKLTTTI